MPFETEIVKLSNGLNVYVERHLFNPDYESVILVNGALATTTSFRQTIKYLGERYNTICFDLPYAGRSKPHNDRDFILTKDDEVDILRQLIARFAPKCLVSVSWGGVASLLALSLECTSVQRAVIASFSPFLNAPMTDYVTRARDYIAAGEHMLAAQLLNDTVGKHLPRMIKLYNYRYLTQLPQREVHQVAFHVGQILALDPERYLSRLGEIACRVKFINGALDEYTPAEQVRSLASRMRFAEFETIPGAGHFLDLEGREQLRHVRAAILGFFGAAAQTDEPPVPGAHDAFVGSSAMPAA